VILSAWKRLFFTFITPRFYGGGGGPSQTTSTVTQSSIPDWLAPQTQAMLGAATQQIFNTGTAGNIYGIKGYNPYSTNPANYVAAFSPLQGQSFSGAAGMQVPGQIGSASSLTYNAAQNAQEYGAQGAGLAGQALGYGGQAAQVGGQAGNLANQALGYGGQAAQAGYEAGSLVNPAMMYGSQAAQVGGQAGSLAGTALGYGAQAAGSGAQYAQMATTPGAIQAYMSPYQKAVTDVQKAGALRDYQVGETVRQAEAAKSGAYGGTRQAVLEAEAQRNLNTQLQGIEAQGTQNAFQAAQQAQQFQAQQQLAGLQAAQQGVGQGLSAYGAQLAGLQGAQQGVGQGLAAYNAQLAGLQGAQQGVGQGLSAYNAQLAGLQGAQQGVGQGLSAYGLGLQGAETAAQVGQALGNLGAQQLQSQQSIAQLQNQFGQQQTQQQQEIINNAINNYAMAQQYPMQQLAMYNALLRGYSTPTSASTTYQAAPSTGSQLMGLAGTALGAYGAYATKKKGGVIKAKSGGLADLALHNTMKGA